MLSLLFFFSSRRRHTRLVSDWSSDVCSSDLLDLLWRGVLRHVRRTVRGRKRAMDFEHFPASIGAKIYVIDINSAVGPQHTKCLQNIIVPVPGLEMHEDHCAINNIHRSIRNAAQIISGYLL